MLRLSIRCALLLAAAVGAGCAERTDTRVEQRESADAFVERVNREIAEQGRELAAAAFTYATYINVDTEFLNAKANERYLEYFTGAVEQAKAFEGETLESTAARAIHLLKLGVAAPAPKDPQKRAQLSALSSKMEGMYGAAKYCPAGPESCKGQTELTRIMAESRNYDGLAEAW